jgi:hypothetical protein
MKTRNSRQIRATYSLALLVIMLALIGAAVARLRRRQERKRVQQARVGHVDGQHHYEQVERRRSLGLAPSADGSPLTRRCYPPGDLQSRTTKGPQCGPFVRNDAACYGVAASAAFELMRPHPNVVS